MNNEDKDIRIKELEEENKKLRVFILSLQNKISAQNKTINKSWDDHHNFINYDRDDR